MPTPSPSPITTTESSDAPLPAPTPGTPPTVAGGSGAHTARTFAPGQSTGVAAKLTDNAARLDVGLLYSGLPRIAQGLGISAIDLTATVAVGVAISWGLITLEAPRGAIALANNADNFLWIRQQTSGSSPEVLVNTTAIPPSGDAVYLGMIRTLAGVPTAVDLGGVIYSRGGMAWRETGDAGEPADTPPAGYSLLTKTAGGLYLWDGEDWYKLVSGGISGTVPLAKLTGGGTDGTLTITNGIITARVDPT
jgi:hypothetical protein